jgi:aspartate racemase
MENRLLGVLGGMGPLASAEFVYTVYRLNMIEPEQQAPALLLHSDPSIPDRTAAILSGDTQELVVRLTTALEALVANGAQRIIIACVTAHQLLPEVPGPLRACVVSLLDLIVDEIRGASGRYILLATNGTRIARIFERHTRWNEVAGRIRFLDEKDQHRAHESIYRLKQNDSVEPLIAWLESLLGKYRVEGLIFGCTELHLLHRALASRGRGGTLLHIVDPLFVAARDLDKLLGGSSPPR